jgi:hypothetical protein
MGMGIMIIIIVRGSEGFTVLIWVGVITIHGTPTCITTIRFTGDQVFISGLSGSHGVLVTIHPGIVLSIMTIIHLIQCTVMGIIVNTTDIITGIITTIITLTEDIIEDSGVQCRLIQGILQALQERLPEKAVLLINMIQGTEHAQVEAPEVLV